MGTRCPTRCVIVVIMVGVVMNYDNGLAAADRYDVSDNKMMVHPLHYCWYLCT